MNGFFGTKPVALTDLVPRTDWITLTTDNTGAFRHFEARLRPEAKHVLFHWYRNVSRPVAFRDLPAADPPSAEELRGYDVLYRWVDPFSEGRNGYVFLRRKASPS